MDDATRDGARVAVKVESEHRTSAREARVMRAMAGKEHFAELLLESSHEGKPFLAMELVGENLADLRSRARGGRFGPRTTCAIAIAMLDANGARSTKDASTGKYEFKGRQVYNDTYVNGEKPRVAPEFDWRHSGMGWDNGGLTGTDGACGAHCTWKKS